jgi:hypothetical protein
MDPVKIKLLGCLPISRRAYLWTSGVCYAFLLMVLIGMWLMPLDTSEFENPALAAIAGNLHWVLLAAIPIAALETWIAMRRFAEQERAMRQRAANNPKTPSPSAPVARETQTERPADGHD